MGHKAIRTKVYSNSDLKVVLLWIKSSYKVPLNASKIIYPLINLKGKRLAWGEIFATYVI